MQEKNKDITEDNLVICNPKQRRSALRGKATWYPYYAGFSPEFAEKVLLSANLPSGARVLDAWNGAGTTTALAHALG